MILEEQSKRKSQTMTYFQDLHHQAKAANNTSPREEAQLRKLPTNARFSGITSSIPGMKTKLKML